MIQFSFFIVHIGVYHIPDVLFNHTDVSDIPLNYCTFIALFYCNWLAKRTGCVSVDGNYCDGRPFSAVAAGYYGIVHNCF